MRRLFTKSPRMLAVAGILAILPTIASISAVNAEPTNPDEEAQAPYVLPDGYTETTLEQEGEISTFVDAILATYAATVTPSVSRTAGLIQLASGAPVAEEIQRLDGKVVGGLTVKVTTANFTPAKVDKAIEAITAATFVNQALIKSYSVGADSDVLTAKISGLDAIGKAMRNALITQLSDIAGGPVALKEAPRFQNLSRKDDSDPWFGGGWMVHLLPPDGLEGDAACSTGFAVLEGGYGRLLSAGHCARDDGLDGAPAHLDWDWRDGTRGDFLATAATRITGSALDSLLVDPVGGTGGQVHGGPWDATSTSTSRYHLSVNAAGATHRGARVQLRRQLR